MTIKILRFITLLFVALSMAMAFCHLLQLPPRMSYDAEMWRSTQSMYQYFGPPVGAIIEGGAWVLAVILAFAVRRHYPAYRWTLLCAICMVAAQAAWWLFVNPVNEVMVHWTVATMPPDWTAYRQQWEFTHAARAILQIIGFSALVISTLVETVPETLRTVATTPFREVSST